MATLSRRDFLSVSTTAAFGFAVVPRSVLGGPGVVPPSEKLNVGFVGVGGRGNSLRKSLVDQCPAFNLAALCDVDERRAAGTIKEYPDLPFYKDYRVMLEKEKGLDAVVVATADHTHAPISILAMRHGKHVYCEKPIAHTVEEARLLRQVAAETKTVTQMGNQGHAGEGLRLHKEFLDAGAIGMVKEIHVWSDRPYDLKDDSGRCFWSPGGRLRPKEAEPIPEGLDWDLWQGPAPEHPYNHTYLPTRWRCWYDYGNNAIGDMMIHNADPAWYALDLGAPEAVEATSGGDGTVDSFPIWNIVTWHFAANDNRGPVKLIWYSGGKLPPPPPGLEPERKLGTNGIYYVGDKGAMMSGGWSSPPRLVPESAMTAFTRPPKTIPRSQGHYREWVDACIAGEPMDAKSGFWYAGPFMEVLLVGTLAIRLNKKIEWDGKELRARNAPEAEPLIRKKYRTGFEVRI